MARKADTTETFWGLILTVFVGAGVTSWLAVTTKPPIWPLWVFVGLAVLSFYMLIASHWHLWPYAIKALDLLVTEQLPEPIAPDDLKLTLRVKNRGESGVFVAPIIGPIVGLVDTQYLAVRLAWEGRPSERLEIFNGGSDVLVIADYDPFRRVFRFRGPASIYAPDAQTVGKEVVAARDEISFVLELREVDSGRATRRRVRIELGSTNLPTVTVSDES